MSTLLDTTNDGLNKRVAELEKRLGGVKCLSDGKIELTSPNKKNTITLSCDDDTVGIWLENRTKKELISIYSIQGQVGVGIYGPAHKEAISIGLSVDKDGNPFIQFCGKDKKVVMLSMEHVQKLVEAKE